MGWSEPPGVVVRDLGSLVCEGLIVCRIALVIHRFLYDRPRTHDRHGYVSPPLGPLGAHLAERTIWKVGHFAFLFRLRTNEQRLLRVGRETSSGWQPQVVGSTLDLSLDTCARDRAL